MGKRSYIILRSLQTLEEQKLDSTALALWANASAFFKGDAVEIELHVAPGEQGISVSVDEVLEGLRGQEQVERSLCGPDDRVASNDGRIGRLGLGPCTCFTVGIGSRGGLGVGEVVFSAGHCVDPDGNGVLDLSGVAEFGPVPASDLDGTINPAPVADQFPVDLTGAIVRSPGETAVPGNDYAIFSIGPNSDGLLPWQKYGIGFRLTREKPAAGGIVRVTGFGSDSGVDNFTRQTATGPYVAENTISSSWINHEYRVNTTGGNSGSPIILELNGLVMGIHTHGGCNPPAGNKGTSFENNQFEADIANYMKGSFAEFRLVDRNHPQPMNNIEGTVFRPHFDLSEAVTRIASGGLIVVVNGHYTAAEGNAFSTSKLLTIRAHGGPAVVGE
ncbi:MAG: trypsin-like serine protease [Patescibacteria group bacterium]